MTDEELAAIRARCEAATAGPWRARRSALDVNNPDAPPVSWGVGAGRETWHNNRGRFHPADAHYPVDEITVVAIGEDGDGIPVEADADFIAHARTDVPALLAEIERLRR